MTFDPISQDVPHDSDFPASLIEFELNHADALLNGIIYQPSGEGLHPLISLLHGLPGHERNFDLAQILRRAGYAVCVFHYRGSWGSGGDYRFAHVIEDTRAVLEHFRQPSFSEPLRIDSTDITLIGHSLGGWTALLTAAQTDVERVASLSGVNIGVWAQQLSESPDLVRPMLEQSLASSLAPLAGVTAQDIIAEVEAHGDQWDLLTHTSTLASKSILLIGAKRDSIVGVFDHHMPLVKALEAQNASQLTTALLPADHVYSGNRIALARTILDWLSN
ncbi:MAG: alpha/beta fold hydrolase [Chloroflexota bacterium]